MPDDADALYRLLLESNPWWESGRVPQELTHDYHRRDFYVLRNELRSRPIVAVGGPRQVGKTTVMYQLISDLLRSGTARERILFFSFDIPGLGAVTRSPLTAALELYSLRVLGAPWRDMKGPVFVFLDEITKFEEWHRDLKGWFDHRYPVKFFVSSSSLSQLQSGAAESLAGRITVHLLLTWKFVDVLGYSARREDWSDLGLRLREAFAAAVTAGDGGPLYDRLRRSESRFVRKRAPLQKCLDRYLLSNGFPELLGISDLTQVARRTREYLDLTLANDLYRVYHIRATGIFEDLLGLVARDSGQIQSYRNLAQLLNIEERTVVEYLNHLSKMFLISQSQFYSASRAKRIRRQRKVLVPNPGFRASIMGQLATRSLSDSPFQGVQAEGVVHDHAKRLVYCLEPGSEPAAYYWRDAQNHEVDVVIDVAGKPVPIEVKYRTNPRRDLDGLQAFLAEHPRSPFGLVVTRDVLGRSDRILYVPLAYFLMMA